jgi:hypothetical protein
MKNWVVYLLLLLTMAGSFIPCCQVDNCPEDQTAATTTNDDHQPEGACSPFFACATCPGFTQLAKTIHLEMPEAVLPKHYPSAINFTITSYTASLLQPPRIA